MIESKVLIIGLMALAAGLSLVSKLIVCEAEKYADETMANALKAKKTGDDFSLSEL